MPQAGSARSAAAMVAGTKAMDPGSATEWCPSRTGCPTSTTRPTARRPGRRHDGGRAAGGRAYRRSSSRCPVRQRPPDGQRRGARRPGCGRAIPDRDCDGQRLDQSSRRCWPIPRCLHAMRAAARQNGHPDAAARVAELVDAHARCHPSRDHPRRGGADADTTDPRPRCAASGPHRGHRRCRHERHRAGVRAMGHQVSGSDLKDSPVAARLRAQGIAVAVGHRADNVGEADAVDLFPRCAPGEPRVGRGPRRGIRGVPAPTCWPPSAPPGAASPSRAPTARRPPRRCSP